MKILTPRVIVEDDLDGILILKRIEKAGRTCYKSEGKITDSSYIDFIKNIIKNGHESVLEHEKVTVRVICDRGVSHEIVRHRIGSYSQESTRYCNYANESFGKELYFIKPCFWDENSEEYRIWYATLKLIEENYFKLLDNNISVQESRSILPNSLKTEIVITYNIREWRHFLVVRTSKNAHPQMREIAQLILGQLKQQIPIVFDDINMEE